MISGRIEGAFSVLALLCVLSIFLFPTMHGPYSVVHGPVSALLSMRAAPRLRLGIVGAGLSAIRGSLNFGRMACPSTTWNDFHLSWFDLNSLAAGCRSILRC